MSVSLNHHIVHSHDPAAGAAFLAEILGLDPPARWGPFHMVELANEVTLDYMHVDHDIVPHHYAFLLSEEEWDGAFERLSAGGHQYWADPGANEPGRINRNDGGRGCYFRDPDGHWLEIITRPYGSGG